MKFEQKQIVFLQRFKRLASGLPKINFLRLTFLQELKPIVICYTYVDLHDALPTLQAMIFSIL